MGSAQANVRRPKLLLLGILFALQEVNPPDSVANGEVCGGVTVPHDTL